MSIPLMYGFMLFSYMWWSRAVIRYATLKTFAKKQSRKRVAIYGAGLAGQQIAAALNRSDDYLPVCFIDDKRSLQGQSLSGLKIYSPKKAQNLENLALKKYYLPCLLLVVHVKKRLLSLLIRQMSKLWNCQG
jgi:FlaA1/EpsC-like NDP-sugar epimerase